jgi:hypothetical protein
VIGGVWVSQNTATCTVGRRHNEQAPSARQYLLVLYWFLRIKRRGNCEVWRMFLFFSLLGSLFLAFCAIAQDYFKLNLFSSLCLPESPNVLLGTAIMTIIRRQYQQDKDKTTGLNSILRLLLLIIIIIQFQLSSFQFKFIYALYQEPVGKLHEEHETTKINYWKENM